MHFRGGREAHGHELGCWVPKSAPLQLYNREECMSTFDEDLGSLLFRYALDPFKNHLGRICHSLDGVESTIDKELDVTFGQSSHALVSLLAEISWWSRWQQAAYLKRRQWRRSTWSTRTCFFVPGL